MMRTYYNFLLLVLIYTLISGCVTLEMFDKADFPRHSYFSNLDGQRLAHLPRNKRPTEPLFKEKQSIEKLPKNQAIPLAKSSDSSQVQSENSQAQQVKQPLQKSRPLMPLTQPECQNDAALAGNLNQNQILSSYRLGAGELISIKVFGEDDFSVTTHLSETGTISYPFLGELQVAGLTVNEVEQQIISGLMGDYLVNPKVTVTVLEYRKVFVSGEVKNSGGYAFVPGLTVNKVISLAGGFTETASQEKFLIVRHDNKSAIPTCANLKSYVRPGDTILVKEYQKFFVDGEIKKPGDYAFKPGLTVKKAISLAGGFTGRASREEIFIVQEGQEAATPLSVTLNTPVMPGDIITVKEYKKFFVNGEIKKPGGYAFEPGLTVEKAIALAGGFTEFSSSRWSKIVILRDEHNAMAPKPVDLNTPVQPGDIITVRESFF